VTPLKIVIVTQWVKSPTRPKDLIRANLSGAIAVGANFTAAALDGINAAFKWRRRGHRHPWARLPQAPIFRVILRAWAICSMSSGVKEPKGRTNRSSERERT
jgi:Pentapeptide repeats (8 copies)